MNRRCKLCELEKTLIKAHIIPESFYKELYDENHRYIEVFQKDGIKNNQSRRKGLYDSGILCKDCDGKLGTLYDDYGAKVFWGYRNLPIKMKDHFDSFDPRVKWREVENIDIARIKLFLLSILWRADVSGLNFYKDVDLGLSHSQRLRSMLMDNYEGGVEDYPILLFHYAVGQPKARQLLSSIIKHKIEGKTLYSIKLCGIMAVWFISTNSVPR
jgi:hypothetical protein